MLKHKKIEFEFVIISTLIQMYKKNNFYLAINLIKKRPKNTQLNKFVLLAFITICLFSFQAFTFAQTITLKQNNVKLTSVLRTIQQQSGYNIFYDHDLIEEDINIDVDFKNKSLEGALDHLLKPHGITYTINQKNIVLAKAAQDAAITTTNGKIVSQQQNQVSIHGKVVDELGNPIAHATIRELDSGKTTTSNSDGSFSIQVNSLPASIQISLVGYNTISMEVSSTNSIEVKLEPSIKEVDEVVVVGYGTQKKINLTGAVSQISGEDLEDRPVANLSQKLQGSIPNLNVNFSSGRPGSVGTFNIRGNTSINGGRPLILIDGVEGNIDRLNPNDVLSVTVLKDASASAIYGARASFGVVLITTKSGEEGTSEIAFSTHTSVSSSTTSNDYETRGYYSAKINDDFFRAYAGKNYTKYTEDDYYQLWIRRNDKTEHPDRPWVVTDDRDGKPTYVYYANTDLHDFLYDDKRPTWQHNLSISGGNEKSRYYVSANLFDQKGMIKVDQDRFKSYNFRVNLSNKVNDWLEFSSNTKFFASNYDFPGYRTVNDLFDFSLYSGLASFVPVNPDGSAVYTTSLMDYRYAEGRVALLTNGYHNNADKWNDFSTIFEATISPFSFLDFKLNYGYNKMFYNTIKRSDNLDYSKYPGEYETRVDDIGLSRLEESRSDYTYHSANIYANFDQDFDNHHLKGVLGFNYETQFIKDVYASREGLITKELDDFNLAKGDVMNITGGRNSYAIAGLFYRLNYDYQGKYLIETSGRYDGSSRFKSGHRFGFFPSVSTGWRLSEETFFEPLKKHINDFKIRYSIGMLGNQQMLGYYDYLQLIDPSGQMSYSFGEGVRAPYASVSDPNSADLTWEKVTTNNLGVDLAMVSNRLTLSLDAYIRNTKDMLTKGMTLPAVYGASSPKQNAADLSTRGWEVAINWKDNFDVLNKSFRYNLGIGLADYTSKITRYDNPTKILSDYYVGQKLGDIWGYKIDGYFQTDEEASQYDVNQNAVNAIINASAGAEKGLKAGDLKYLDLDGDKEISLGANTADSPGDRVIIGNSQPRYTYGVNFSADWNNIDLSFFLQGILKQHWYPAPHSMAFWGPYSRPFASFIPANFMDDVWSPENPDAYFPRPRGYIAMATNRALGAVNDRYMQNIGYMRLKNITLGYSFNSKAISKAGIKNVRIYVTGENVLTFTKLKSKYIDPEQAAGSSGTSKVYPWARTFAVGIDIKL